VNENHAVCGTPEWAEQLQREILTPLLGSVELGERMIEVGPGPGAATDWLRHRVRELVAVEIEPDAAAALERRFADSNVTVAHAEATSLPYPAETFDSAATFTMLHHVPTRAAQRA
jgi:16S rRNA A1518/A1519 N6-dimethyltransferase RsmA/KsgA/DIM1 with predicted DNA glycosylase/AP lyase activity